MIKMQQMQLKKSKKAFSMVTAIVTIVIMATLTSLIMSVTGKTMKATTQQYQKEQAALLARSYTELALLYVSGYDRTGGDCIETITAHFGPAHPYGYDITTNIQYIGKEAALVGCGPALSRLNGGSSFDETMSIIVDIYIKYRNLDDPLNRDITFHRRSLQKL
ncbi:type II secretion system GspH family protein [bacterium]|nr:type II secretion system GspH family protein [bacterium]MBU1957889.1 type II secretion system GspH family protein [bacterium]